MTTRGEPSMLSALRARARGDRALVVMVVAMLAVVTVARVLVTKPGWGITLLYDVPVALAAVALGLRAGLVTAATAFGLYVFTDRAFPIQVNGLATHQNGAGLLSRALVFGVLGGLLGVYADRLRATERLLAGVLSSTHDAIVSTDAAGTVVGFNVAAERIFGRPATAVVGTPLTDLVPTLRLPATGPTVELAGVRANGERFPVEVSLSSFDDRGRTFFTGVFADVTERKAAEADRQAYQAQLERSNADLEQFAYIASHDLREPLRSIGSFSRLIERRYRDKLDEDADKYIDFIVGGVDRMQELIDDLLAYSRAGRDGVQRKPTDMQAIGETVAAALEQARVDAGAEINVRDLPTLSADPRALTQVLQNLVANALKFTNGGTPVVDVGAERGDGGWTFAVADNGIGIEPEHAERVFRMFQRLHARNEYGGTGIGLAICKTIVERHGGHIWCEPRDGGGTVFRFTIPDQS